ncbi:MAG: TetR family transcriptional regulator [Actinomycetes bacterium]
MPATRDALLDAAYEAVVSGGWPKARMADVAQAAGVSRQTLYNEFGSKDALAQALTLREADRFLDAVDAALTGHEGGPAEAVGVSVAAALRLAADNPLVKAVLTDDTDAGGLLPFLTTRAEPLLAAARSRFLARLHEDWPAIDPVEAELAAETVVRLTVSYLVLPAEAVDLVAARVAHLVEKLLAAGARP